MTHDTSPTPNYVHHLETGHITEWDESASRTEVRFKATNQNSDYGLLSSSSDQIGLPRQQERVRYIPDAFPRYDKQVQGGFVKRDGVLYHVFTQTNGATIRIPERTPSNPVGISKVILGKQVWKETHSVKVPGKLRIKGFDIEYQLVDKNVPAGWQNAEPTVDVSLNDALEEPQAYLGGDEAGQEARRRNDLIKYFALTKQTALSKL